MKFALLSIIALAVAGALIFTGYTKPKTTFVSIQELTSNPQAYNRKAIKTTGIWLVAFEVNGLAQSTETRDNHTYLKDPVIWLEAPTIRSKQNCFEETGGFKGARFCQVDTEGIFEYGDSYGHVGAYKFQISPIPENPIRLNLWRVFCALQGKVLSIGPACVDMSQRAIPLL